MTRYISDFNCASCHQKTIWNSDTQTLSCECGNTHADFVNLRNYQKLPEDHLQQQLDTSFLEKGTKEASLTQANFVTPEKPSPNDAESDKGNAIRLEASETVYPPKENVKRIPEGTVFGEIPLEAAKSYPIRIWEQAYRNFGATPKIAYADLNTHGEQNTLSVKLLPNGGKTAPHPQINLFVNGPYHVENLGYTRSDPWNWTTWQEVLIDAKHLDQLINALIQTKLTLMETAKEC